MSESWNISVGLDALRFRDTLSHFASGVTIVAGMDRGVPVGFTCQAFYAVSIEPPLVSFSVMRTSTSYPRIALSGRFSVNVLAHDQGILANQFAKSGSDKWADVGWVPSRLGNPIIADTLMWVDCELWAEYEAGDHLIVLGQVRDLSPKEWHTREPLLFFKGKYRNLHAVDSLES